MRGREIARAVLMSYIFSINFINLARAFYKLSNLGQITVNGRRLVRLASDVTKYVIVHFLFWSRDQYRASMLKAHIQITM